MRVDFRAAIRPNAGPRRDLILLTLDALRYDVAEAGLRRGLTPNLGRLVGTWERRHSPATFTLPAHEAFFAGFFPTPLPSPTSGARRSAPAPSPRPLALRFSGSRSIGRDTLVLDGPCLIRALTAEGYHSICIGGTGFFDPSSPLGAALPGRFTEAWWSRELGVSARRASWNQLSLAARRLTEISVEQPVLLFMNLAATHPPTRLFVKGATVESTETQLAALADLDRHLPILTEALSRRGGAVGIVCADHGTCFGDDGLWGHRLAHPAVWEVPYAEVEIR